LGDSIAPHIDQRCLTGFSSANITHLLLLWPAPVMYGHSLPDHTRRIDVECALSALRAQDLLTGEIGFEIEISIGNIIGIW
mgnify:CR=1